jgi:hypothetical protein
MGESVFGDVFCVVLSASVLSSDHSGSPWLNSGITPVITRLLGALPLKLCMTCLLIALD